MRAEGKSFSEIAASLHISKSTCSKWEEKLETEIATLKQEELNSLYDAYGMKKKARIQKLGNVLNRIDDALDTIGLTEMAPEKLLDFKLKYAEALQKEYTSTKPAFTLDSGMKPEAIVTALSDLLNRVRNGEVSTEQANKESLILSNLLKAYEQVELKDKLDEIETIIGGSR